MVRRCVSCALPALVLLACHTSASPRRTLQAASKSQFKTNGTNAEETANRTILDILEDDASLKDLKLALNLSGLLDSLCDPAAEFTLFAPVNFSVSSNYWAWKAHLRNILNLHILPGRWTRSELLMERKSLQMENGEETDVQVIDNTTTTAIRRSPGSTIQHEILKADIVAANGIVHKINSTMHPFWYDLSLIESGIVAAQSAQDRPFVIGLNILSSTDAVFTQRPLTAFAPIDAAFCALGAATLAYFFDPANKQETTDFAEGHLVNGIYSTDDLEDGQVLQTRGSTQVVVSVTKDTVKIQDAALIDVAHLANNGIIYSLDRVILSPAQHSIVQQIQPTTTPPSEILPCVAPSNTQYKSVAPASAPLTLVFRSVTLQLNFKFVVDRLSEDNLQVFEKETELFYQEFFKVEGQRLGVQDVTTTIRVRNQTVDESSLTLKYNQTFSYISLGNPLLDDEQFVTTAFIDATANSRYWIRLLSHFPGLLDTKMVPEILDEPTVAPSSGESGDGRMTGANIGAATLGGIFGGVLSFAFLLSVSIFLVRRKMTPVDAVPAAEMVVNSDTPPMSTRPAAIVEILPVDPILTPLGSEIKDIEADGPRFKDQCRLVGALKSGGETESTSPSVRAMSESFEAQLSFDGPQYKDQVRNQTSGHSKPANVRPSVKAQMVESQGQQEEDPLNATSQTVDDQNNDDEFAPPSHSQSEQIHLNSDYTASV